MARRDELLRRAKAKRRLDMLRAAPPEDDSTFGTSEDPRLRESMEATGQYLKSALSGVGESFAKPIYGALDLADVDMGDGGFLNKESRQKALKTFEEETDKSAFGTAGELIGDISKFALPGAGLVKALGTGSKLARATGAAADIGTAATLGALETPDKGETRGDRALEEALFAAGGLGAGKVLEKAVQGARKMKGAKEYIREGGYLTPGMAAKSPAIRGSESVMEVTPFLARGVKEARKDAEFGFNEKIINQVARQFDDTAKTLPAGHEGMEGLGRIVKKGYDDAWDAVNKDAWFSGGQDSFIREVDEVARGWADTEAKALGRIAKVADGGDLKQVDSRIRKMKSNAEGDFLDELNDLQESLRAKAGEEAMEGLAKMDAGYGNYLALQGAAAKTDAGEFGARQLVKSARQVGGKSRAAKGQAPMQQQAEELATMMDSAGMTPLDFFRRLSNISPTPMPQAVLKKIGNLLIGETDPQRAAQLILENPEARAALRRMTTATGAAIGEQ